MSRVVRRALLFVRIWGLFALITALLRVRPLPLVVRRLAVERSRGGRVAPLHLGHIVRRALSVLGYEPRCVTASLVLYRLLREQGDAPELVIGLPEDARDPTAHAWIELDGHDVGPPPGRQGHTELARYTGSSRTALEASHG